MSAKGLWLRCTVTLLLPVSWAQAIPAGRSRQRRSQPLFICRIIPGYDFYNSVLFIFPETEMIAADEFVEFPPPFFQHEGQASLSVHRKIRVPLLYIEGNDVLYIPLDAVLQVRRI